MQRILPPVKVRRMMLTGERVPAAEFYRLGAVEACLPDAELMPAALDMASAIAAKPPGAVRRIRGAFSTVEALERARRLSRRAGLHDRTQPLARRRGGARRPSSNGARESKS